MNFRYTTLLLSIVFQQKLISNIDNGSVEHKNSNIIQYLNEISTEQEEKTQILEHILDKSHGTYIDLGTGGDSISHILNNIPADLPIKLIGSDIDESILNAIPKRHPEICHL